MNVSEEKGSWRDLKPWDRHALTLIVAGVTYIFIGITMVVRPWSGIREETLELALSVMPHSGWGVWFIVIGAFTVMSSRWPSIPKSLGYSVLTGWSVLWAGFNIIGGASNGTAAYLATGIMWVMVSFLWWVVSGFVSPPRVRKSIGYTTTSGRPAGSFDRSNLCLLDAEAGLTSPDQDSGGESSECDGDRSV